MKTPRIVFGYVVVVVTSLSSSCLDMPRIVLFVTGGSQTELLEDKLVIDCAKQIDELVLSNMPDLENVVVDGINANMQG